VKEGGNDPRASPHHGRLKNSEKEKEYEKKEIGERRKKK
jgi:hypothetical protein